MAKTHDDAMGELAKALLNSLVTVATTERNEPTDPEKIRAHLTSGPVGSSLDAITAISSYMAARAAERQALALESVAKTVSKIQEAETANTDAQAIVDDREPQRDRLASTYSLPSSTLALLWAMRGMLMDASIKSLSRPDRFDPFRKVNVEEVAWSLRMTSSELIGMLPRNADGIDYELLEDFGIMHYGGTADFPDDWMYGG